MTGASYKETMETDAAVIFRYLEFKKIEDDIRRAKEKPDAQPK